MANYNWIAPHNTAEDLRGGKSHLDNGGVVSAQRAQGEIAAIVSRGANGKTTEEGAMLNVTKHDPSNPTGPLAQEIEMAGSCFVGRTASPQSSVPEVRHYAPIRADFDPYPSWPTYVVGEITDTISRLGPMAAHASFISPQ